MYYIYSLLTAPGVIIHELGHTVFCVLGRVKVREIKLFRFGNPAGYVIHDQPGGIISAILISFGPLVVNTLLTLFLFSQVLPPYLSGKSVLFLWLGVAIGLHAIPSTQDAKSLLQTANHKIWKNPLVLLGYPFVLVLYVLNLLKRIHFDFVYVALLFWVGNILLKSI
jgi:hypothetical protein